MEAIGAPDFAVALPPAAELPAELLRLAVPHHDINDLVALLPTPERSAELWWVLERCAHTLVRSMGSVERPPPFPALPQRMGALRRYFYVYCVQPDLQGLTPHTTPERAIVDHLQAGRHWRSGAGWLRL